MTEKPPPTVTLSGLCPSHLADFMEDQISSINAALAAVARAQPQQEPPPEEPDYTCPACGCHGRRDDQGYWIHNCKCLLCDAIAAANAKIRALGKERDEAREAERLARADAESWHSGWQVAVRQLDEARRELGEARRERDEDRAEQFHRGHDAGRREGREEAREELAQTFGDAYPAFRIRAHVFAAEKGGAK